MQTPIGVVLFPTSENVVTIQIIQLPKGTPLTWRPSHERKLWDWQNHANNVLWFCDVMIQKGWPVKVVPLLRAAMPVVKLQAVHHSMPGFRHQIHLFSCCGFLVNRSPQSTLLGWVRCSQTLRYRGCRQPTMYTNIYKAAFRVTFWKFFFSTNAIRIKRTSAMCNFTETKCLNVKTFFKLPQNPTSFSSI